MSSRSGWLVLGFVAVTAGGCAARVEFVPMIPSPRPLIARAPGEVETFVVTPPLRPHVDLGLVQVVSGTDARSFEEMIDRLREEAGARGCDALVITMIDARRSRRGHASVEGSCEIYTDGATAVVPAPAAAKPLSL